MNAAQKLQFRAENPDKVQRYPANQGAAARSAHAHGEQERFRQKMEARVAAFAAGRKPDENGFLDVSVTKGDSRKEDVHVAAPEATSPAGDAPKAKGDSRKG